MEEGIIQKKKSHGMQDFSAIDLACASWFECPPKTAIKTSLSSKIPKQNRKAVHDFHNTQPTILRTQKQQLKRKKWTNWKGFLEIQNCGGEYPHQGFLGASVTASSTASSVVALVKYLSFNTFGTHPDSSNIARYCVRWASTMTAGGSQCTPMVPFTSS